MRTTTPKIGRSTYCTVREAAWILGTEPASISRAIRLGSLRAVQRRGRLVVPASALARLLGQVDTRPRSGGTP